MIVRMRYEAEGAHVSVRVFTGPNPANCGLSGTLKIRLDDWPHYKAMMEDGGAEVLPDLGRLRDDLLRDDKVKIGANVIADYQVETGADSDARVQDAMATLESLVDRAGLANVVECLAIVCEDKAEHIRANWQDTRSANGWARASNALDKAAERIKKTGPVS